MRAMMTEKQWVAVMAKSISGKLGRRMEVHTGKKLPYAFEMNHLGEIRPEDKTKDFETDMLIVETLEPGKWKPRVVIEAKFRSISTHSAMVYSHKADLHKKVFPFLRYGIMLGKRDSFPLPGRLYRHGPLFDFMFSFRGEKPSSKEQASFLQLLRAEIRASRDLQSIFYDTRKASQPHYTLLHRRLVLR